MKLVCGVGINDADYAVKPRVNGKMVECQSYSSWKNMLERCYSAKYHRIQPTYIGVKVCGDWLSFMAFRKWWVENQVDGWQLDKDLLSDDRIYSPEACIFVPSWLNHFPIDRAASRGEWPVGVNFDKSSGKLKSRCSHPFGTHEYLGLFSTPGEAHAAWLARKLEIAHELKHLMDYIDARIFPRVIEIISRAK